MVNVSLRKMLTPRSRTVHISESTGRLLSTVIFILTPVSQMEVGCSRIWGLVPTTQTQVGGTPHRPYSKMAVI